MKGNTNNMKSFTRKFKGIFFKVLRKIKTKMCDHNPENMHLNDFNDFLAYSMVSPMIYSPFNEAEKRCFAMMENVSKYLANKGLKLENKKLVSIIMPVYNRKDIVQKAIDSILKQTYPKFELIIVDDGSDDGTSAVLDEIQDPRIKILKNKTCLGVSIARNKGLEICEGEYIAYLDSDNTWEPNYLAAMVGGFKELPDAAAVYGGQFLYKTNRKRPEAIRFGSFNISLLQNHNYIDINTFCHKKEVFDKIGGFDETLKRFVDWDYIMRISDEFKIYSLPVLLSNYYYEKAENTITNNTKLLDQLELLRKKQKKRKIQQFKKASIIKTPAKNISIIIPSYESLDDLKDCIGSILEMGLNKMMEIIVVDNASSQPIINYLTKLEKNKKIKLILNDINYGFSYAVNQGISITEPSSDILILNNDAIVTPGSIEIMSKYAYNLPKCGIIVPQQVLPPETKTIKRHVPYAYTDYECDVNLSAHHKNMINTPIFHSGKIVELKFAPFFCAYIKREVLNDSKGLDAEYGRHYRSDRILCDYIRHILNLKIYYVSDSIVYHKLQKSTDLLLETQKNDKEFDLMFNKNQWTDDLRNQLGYRKAPWDD